MSNWFITGVSRGFGKILTQELLAQGHHVVGTTRSGDCDLSHANLTIVKLDVTDVAQTTSAIDTAVKKLGTLDVVVNNAGFGIVGAIEEVSRDEIDTIFETNFYGTYNVLQAVLPTLRKQGRGHIMNFSSVGGFLGLPGFGAYNAAKFAVEGMSEALAAEVKPLGINVTIIEPGPFRTDFLTSDSLLRAKKEIDGYKATAGQTRDYADKRNGSQPGDPALAVKVILQAAASPTPPLRLPLGADAIERIRGKLKSVESDIAQWEEFSAKTSFPAEKSAT
jgi:NAD(P)-dependent dehydrogenase (short-subunit alcohol dehydrogenase family)